MAFRNRSADVSRFSMVPRADIPRSVFAAQMTHKTTFDAGKLIPVYVDEVLPGDSFKLSMTAFTRLATPLFPIMDNLILDSFFFYVPLRLLWSNFERFMGEQDTPGASTSYLIPVIGSPVGGHEVGEIYDYMGLPTVGQVEVGAQYQHSALFLRAYALIWNEWFRDENLQVPNSFNTGDGPDDPGLYVLRPRGKRHDYFTSALPWAQKGAAVGLPLAGLAPVEGLGRPALIGNTGFTPIYETGDTTPVPGGYTHAIPLWQGTDTSNQVYMKGNGDGTPAVYANLGETTATTINALRQAFQIQRLLERDARGGTRYTELVRSHFGVTSPDQRLQRPEYLGGGSTPISINAIANTAAPTAPTEAPVGQLGAIGHGVASNHGFSQSFTEHGILLGLVAVRADLTYQQGLHKMWSRRTRYDFYWPAFAHLGEQAILSKEIYCTGVPGAADDDAVFGYQERWAEYRHKPSRISGLFRSTSAGTLDAWHLAQRFTSRPTLNGTFIQDAPPVDRVLAVTSAPGATDFLFDSFFDVRMVRAIPAFSTPGLIDHF